MSATTTSTEKPVATEATKALKEKAQSHEKYNQLGETLQKKKGDLTSAEERLKEAKSKHVQGSQKSEEFKKAESDVKTLKDEINKLTKEWRRADPNKLLLDREEFEEHLLRRFFVIPSFEIYGGVAGLYDFGPVGCAVKANVINLWRRHFILEENMLELDMPCLTPEPVFLASGHVQRFADFMVRDSVTNECYRADKLIGEFIETELENPAASAERIEELKKVLKEIDGYDKTQLGECIKKFSIKSPAKNDVSEPFPFNLMFSTQIGPTGKFTGYLRPETAQGIFVNFKRLLDFNGGQLPFAGATVGQAFRNEIAPRSGLLRVREFTLAEIEHFMNPKTSGEVHPKFDRVKSIRLPLLSKENQLIGKPATFLTIDEAVQQGVMKNTTLAYFIGRTYQFMIAIGILPEGIRFRQHMATEMAHYASDCWDCELLTSYGWIECVGLADRSCYDLSAHATAAKTDLVAFETYKTPIIEEVLELNVLNKGKFASTLKAEKENVTKKLQALNDEEKLALQEELTKNGKISFSGFELSKDIIEFKKVQKKKTGETFVPSVIEPSFGIGRIIYCVLEHCFWKREGADEEEEKGKKTVARTVFSFPPVIAPVKCAVLPLQNNSKFDPIVQQLSDKLTYRGISNKVDTAGQSIGKRYSRQDDVGVPLIVTIDFDTLTNNTVTIRERDSCTQVRAQLDEAVQSIADFVEGRTSWQQIREKYPEQAETASAKVGKK